MVHISEPISDIFDRRELPIRIQMILAFGPFAPGVVLEWSDADRCYMDQARRWCLWACNVRQMLGVAIRTAPPKQQDLFAA
jgi:hypothetical protein